MRKWMIWTFLLLLLAGGIVWFMWPRPSGILYSYLPKGTDVIVSLNTSQWAKTLAKEKIQHGSRVDALLSKAEELTGLSLKDKASGQGMQAIDVWESPLLVYVPNPHELSLLLALLDSAEFESMLKEQYNPSIFGGENFRYGSIPDKGLFVAWNKEVLVLMEESDEEVLLKKAGRIFQKQENPSYLSRKKLSTQKAEISTWIDPSYLALSPEYFEAVYLEIDFQGEELHLNLSLKAQQGKDLSGWARGGMSNNLTERTLPARMQLSTDPALYLNYFDRGGNENTDLNALLEIMTGQVSLAVTDTISRINTRITYAYDDNFERVPVAQSFRKKGFKWLGVMETRDEPSTRALLDEFEQKGLLQKKGRMLQLIDLLDQELFISQRGMPGKETSLIISHADSTGSVDDAKLLVGKEEQVPGKWIQGRIEKEFWPIVAAILGEEWLRWEGVSASVEGEAGKRSIELEVVLQAEGEESALLRLGELLSLDGI